MLVWWKTISSEWRPQGRLQSQVTDDQLKQILISLQQPKRDFKISRR